MADKSTFIKIDRNILRWGWYQDGNTLRVFLHLLLTANIKPHVFKGVQIGRGEAVTSYASLSKTLGISTQSARTAISHLKLTGEITTKQQAKFTVISIVNYDAYQATNKVNNKQINKQLTSNQQHSKNNKEREETVYTPAAQINTKDEREDFGGVFLTNAEFDELEALVKNKGEFLAVIDRVGEWLTDNPRPKSKHKTVVKTFLRNDGLI